MASTPLYKSLKTNGTTFYAFPGAAEDISAAYQNSNYKMYFSKFVLLNFPKQTTSTGTQSNQIRFDFNNAFQRSVNATPTATFNEAIVESLRNYVANHEVVLRESRKNNKDYFYNVNALGTATEKIFWKWCKKLNVIDFEPAIPEDEFFSNLTEFRSNKDNDDSYFQEYLWKEREIINWDTVSFKASEEAGLQNKLEVEFNGLTNFKVGDTVAIYNVTNNQIATGAFTGMKTQEGMTFFVSRVLPASPQDNLGPRVIFNVDATFIGTTRKLEEDGQAELIYNRLVQYVGEITGVSNVQEANRSYTEVYAHVPDHTGMTPDVLFRTSFDENYAPNLRFPIIASQIQPEILGAELFNSPIVSSPQNYPGSYLAQFDTLDFTYETSSGDILRRSGEYYGIGGDKNNIAVSSTKLDGLGLDFNTSHYVKMNIPGKRVTNFDQFNAMQVNNLPPDDFEFNAILWYYTVEDNNGNSANNLYGISFLDNPNNNNMLGEKGLRFPTYTKLVSNGNQDGTSFAFNLNLNFNVVNENPQQAYNPEAINSAFSMNLFNSAMQRLASLNDSFSKIILDYNNITNDVANLKSLVYNQNDVSTINAKIRSLEDLIKLYSTIQVSSSETIAVQTLPGSPPQVVLSNTTNKYSRIDNVLSTNLYNSQGRIPLRLTIPESQDLLINVVNDDNLALTLPNNDNLLMTFTNDLSFRQSVEISINATDASTQNKKLDVYMINSSNNPILLVGNIDLPVFYNANTKSSNCARKWDSFGFDINYNSNMVLSSGSLLTVPMSANLPMLVNSVKVGETLYLSDFLFGTASIIDFSGQYEVVAVSETSPEITFDLSSNQTVVDYLSKIPTELPKTIQSSTTSMLSSVPRITLNKGKKIVITRISQTSEVPAERYSIEIKEL